MIIYLFYYSHLKGCDVISHCGFDLHFPNGHKESDTTGQLNNNSNNGHPYEHPFVCFLVIYMFSLDSFSIFKLGYLSFYYWVIRIPYMFWIQSPCVYVCSVAQMGPGLCDSMDCGPPGSSVYGVFLARILEWIATSSFRGSSQPRDWTLFPALSGGFFTTEPPGKAYQMANILFNFVNYLFIYVVVSSEEN